ncbi:hypothetical protein PAPYR_2723 [Paratrimastix pyriformis]|uniref:Tyrosine specific protein phosphatases domain-containing protein n=1 Tax=Paratrimastix pyriformis TaxID=342808 RepID=A0ABQ8UP00_9EUKA|nr:hypothetical protein PAPYR_2723 [Paratrimastix pyriformis]
MGPKMHLVQLPGCNQQWGQLWRCPMPFSRMFDPNGAVLDEMKEHGIQTIVSLAHRGECDYHTGRDLERLYMLEGYEVLSYSIDDHCVPRDMKAFRDFVVQVRQRLIAQRNVAVHCHAGTGRTGLLLACLVRLEAPQHPVEEVIRYFRETVHGAIHGPTQATFVTQFPGAPN